jgi:hypothetical protein
LEGVLGEDVTVLVRVDHSCESSEGTHSLVLLHITEESIDPLFRFSNNKLYYFIKELSSELPLFIVITNKILEESLALNFISKLVLITSLFKIIVYVIFKVLFIVVIIDSGIPCSGLFKEFSLYPFKFLLPLRVRLPVVVLPFLSIAVFARFTPFLYSKNV